MANSSLAADSEKLGRGLALGLLSRRREEACASEPRGLVAAASGSEAVGEQVCWLLLHHGVSKIHRFSYNETNHTTKNKSGKAHLLCQCDSSTTTTQHTNAAYQNRECINIAERHGGR